jgi:hypothetical protein
MTYPFGTPWVPNNHPVSIGLIATLHVSVISDYTITPKPLSTLPLTRHGVQHVQTEITGGKIRLHLTVSAQYAHDIIEHDPHSLRQSL